MISKQIKLSLMVFVGLIIFTFYPAQKTLAMICAGDSSSFDDYRIITESSEFSVGTTGAINPPGNYTHSFSGTEQVFSTLPGPLTETLHSYIKSSSGAILSTLTVTCTAEESCSETRHNLVNLSPGYYELTTEGRAWSSSWVWGYFKGCASVSPEIVTPPPPTRVNGSCGSTRNSCTAGTSVYPGTFRDTSNFYKWNCEGSGGGTDAYCTVEVPPSPVNGQCGTTNNSCISGNLSDLTDTSTLYLWNCSGTSGGTTASCSITKPAPTTYTLTVNLSPSSAAGRVGTYAGSSNPDLCTISCGAGETNCTTYCGAGVNPRLIRNVSGSNPNYTWAGWSLNGGPIQNLQELNFTMSGNTTVTANWTANTPTVVNGVCSTSVNVCTAGTYVDATDTTTHFLWNCNGSGGGTNASCSAAKIITPPPVVNSQCGTAQRAYTAAETAFSGTLCAVGNSYPTSGYWPTPGTYVPTFPAAGGSVSWKCVGSTGSDATCTATRAAIVVTGPVTLTVTSCVNSSVRISWGAVPSAWSYAVYRNGSLISQTSNTYLDIPNVLPSYTFRVTSLVGYTPIVETALTPDVSIPPGSVAGTVSGVDYPTRTQASLFASHPSPTGNPAVPVISGVNINNSILGAPLTATSTYYLVGSADVQSQSGKLLHLDYYTMPDESSSWTLKGSEDIDTGYVLGGVNQVNRRGQFSLGPFTNSVPSGHDLFYYINAYPTCIVDYAAEHSWQSGFKNFNIGSTEAGTCNPITIGTYLYGSTGFRSTLCSTGIQDIMTPVFPQPGHSLTWHCFENGLSSPACTATHLAETASCGQANRTYSSTETSFTFPLCSGGTPVSTPTFPDAGSSVTWDCKGSGAGFSVPCSATRNAAPTLTCNSLHLKNPSDSPLVNLYVLTTWEILPPVNSPDVTVHWKIADANGTTTATTVGSSDLNKTFTTIGLKTVTAYMASTTGSSRGNDCTATTSITQQGGDNREN